MRRNLQYVFALVVAIAVTAVVAGTAVALPPNPYTAPVTFSNPILGYSNQLTAAVTVNPDGSYHYLYTVVYSHAAFGQPLAQFSVANLDNLPYSGWGSDHTYNTSFSDDSILWVDGTAQVGQTVKFWYDSFNPYGFVDCTLSGGLPSGGTTLGMIVPEPGSLAALVCGFGVLWTQIRRRR